MTEYISRSLEETKAIAQKVLDTGARIIALHGDLGAGKTALTKCIAELLGITETVTSPTFVIMKSYETPLGSKTRHSPSRGDIPAAYAIQELVHIDAYRLTSGKELEALKFKEILDDPHNLIIIEWPEIVKDVLPAETLTVRCDFIDESARKYSF